MSRWRSSLTFSEAPSLRALEAIALSRQFEFRFSRTHSRLAKLGQFALHVAADLRYLQLATTPKCASGEPSRTTTAKLDQRRAEKRKSRGGSDGARLPVEPRERQKTEQEYGRKNEDEDRKVDPHLSRPNCRASRNVFHQRRLKNAMGIMLSVSGRSPLTGCGRTRSLAVGPSPIPALVLGRLIGSLPRRHQ